MNRSLKYFLLILFLWICNSANGQTYLETFGQNRIQYRKFQWKYFDTKHFRIYHYDASGRDLARYVAEEAETDIRAVERKMGGQFPKRFNIILYNNYDEYKQSNIGLKYDGQIQDIQNAGTVDLVGDKLVVYYTGKHTDLRHQIRAGMAHVVMERMIFGENIRKMVKNALLLNLPPWVTAGFISYLVDGWDTKTNSDWKNLINARPMADFNTLSEQYPELAGKAFWEFLSQNYGNGSIKRLLFSMEEKSNLNKGVKEVLGIKIRKAYDSCLHFYKLVYQQDALTEDHPDSTKDLVEIKVPKDNTVVRNIVVSPRGRDVAFVTWKNGEYQVYIEHTQQSHTRSLLLEGGRSDYNETPDPNYPMLAWSNNGLLLAVLYKKDNHVFLRMYNSLKARETNFLIPDKRFDRILGMSFMEDDNFMVFSAIRKSQSDIYKYDIKKRKFTNVTNDLWDDLQPTFVSGGSRRGILFLSNRPKPNLDVPREVNEMPTGPMNVYFYDTKTESPVLLQCSHVTKGHVTQPIQYGPDNFAYLYDENGIWNKYVVLFVRNQHNRDSAVSVPITNYSENILAHQYNPASNQVADVVQEGDKYKVYFKKLEFPGLNTEPKILQPTKLFQGNNGDSIPRNDLNEPYLPVENTEHKADNENHQQESTEPIIKSGNAFQTEFNDTTQPAKANEESNSNIADITNPAVKLAEPGDTTVLTEINDSTYIKMRPAPYRLSFKPDFLTIRLDNSILFNQYQSYQNSGGSYTNPSLGGLITLSINDALENHRFTGGFQLPINFSGLAYFMQYENFERRIDWGLLFLHTEDYYNYPITYIDSSGAPLFQKIQLGKAVTNMLQLNASYPLDHVRSIRFHTALREDAMHLKAVDTLSLYDIPHNVQYWTLNRLEFVFDNTTNPALNIRTGFRYKIYGEYMFNISTGAQSCFNVGIDFRYYHKLYKNFIWANRIASAHSEGNNKVVYYVGGVDNWLNQTYNDYVPVNGGPYAFQMLATNLRGYNQNAYNGNTYFLLNEELRLPIFPTFMKRPVQSSILKNLQLVGFLDAGSAWNGLIPNPNNTSSAYLFPPPGSPGNVIVTINVPDANGFGVGYGAGLRTMILGYFVRVDAAWNIDGIRKPIWYLSFGTDF
jgi:hypothetical protein